MELDTTKLVQAGQRKLTPHDNCIVLDVGTGTFPRLVELRLTGVDGARQSALWDGSIDLAVDDIVIADEYSGQTVWRISSMGGGDSGAGKARVNKVWASDFTSESLVTDASDNVTLNTGTLTLPSDIIHLGDVDTKWSFDTDKVSVTVGGLLMIEATETTQNILKLGDVSGGGDVDILFNNGQAMLLGSTGNFGVGTTNPQGSLAAEDDTQAACDLRTFNSSFGSTFIGQTSGGTKASPTATASGRILMRFSAGGYTGSAFTFAQAAIDMRSAELFTASAQGTNIRFSVTPIGSTTNTEKMRLESTGFLGINGVTSPSTELDIGAGAIEFNEMTAPGVGAANTARLYAVDNGAGKTQLIVIFSSGAAQVLATQP